MFVAWTRQVRFSNSFRTEKPSLIVSNSETNSENSLNATLSITQTCIVASWSLKDLSSMRYSDDQRVSTSIVYLTGIGLKWSHYARINVSDHVYVDRNEWATRLTFSITVTEKS